MLSSKLLKLNLPSQCFNDTINNFISWQMYNIQTFLCYLMVNNGIQNTVETTVYNLLFSSIRNDKLSVLDICASDTDKRKNVWCQYFPNSQIYTTTTTTVNTINSNIMFNVIIDSSSNSSSSSNSINSQKFLNFQALVTKLQSHGIYIIQSVDYTIKTQITPLLYSSSSSSSSSPQFKLFRFVDIPNVKDPMLIVVVN
jgi:hypothetical protein